MRRRGDAEMRRCDEGAFLKESPLKLPKELLGKIFNGEFIADSGFVSVPLRK